MFTCAVMAGCGQNVGPVDTGRRFVGEWGCGAGERELDCDGVVSVVDLASGIPDFLRFSRGTTSDLVMTMPSRVLVPGLPDGPTCDLEMNSPNGEDATLSAEPTCVDDAGAIIAVHRVLVQVPWHTLHLTTSATTGTGCRVETEYLCWAQ